MASISKRDVGGQPRYDVNYRQPDGRRRRKTYVKAADARRFAASVEADKARGAWIDPDAGRVTFQNYAQQLLKGLTTAPTSRARTETRLRVHAFPTLGAIPLANVKPSTIQTWQAGLPVAPSTRKSVLQAVSWVFRAAVDDELIAKNPCAAKSVAKPKVAPTRITPWSMERVFGVRDALPEHFKVVVDLAFGLGLRQGEVFGLAVDDVDFLRGKVTVRRQVRRLDGHKGTFALPKGGKEREVPLPASVADALAAHLATYPAAEVTLPWGELDGKPTSARLIVTREDGRAVDGGSFGERTWRRALDEASAVSVAAWWKANPKAKSSDVPADLTIERCRANGMHILRHTFASVLLDAGENIRALSEYLGHSDPGFTLRTYTHLMPTSDDRTRRAIDGAFGCYTGATSADRKPRLSVA